jgi:hypothetical protein
MASNLERTDFDGLASSKLVDPWRFAACVREFALDAHRILNDPFATARDLVELSGRIDELWRNCPGGAVLQPRSLAAQRTRDG